MTKNPKGFVALTTNSCKCLPLALEHVLADKKNSHAQSCVYVCPISPFTIQKSENNVQVMMIRQSMWRMLCDFEVFYASNF